MRALIQLQRVARQSALTREAGLPQIAVLRDPTTGGGWATLGAGADVDPRAPGAQVGFAGSRVRPPDADPAAYTAEAQLAAGAVDAVVPPAELRGTLGAVAAPAQPPVGRGRVPPPPALGRAPTCPPPAGTRCGAPVPRNARVPPPTWTPTSPSRGNQRRPLRRHRRRDAVRVRALRRDGRRPTVAYAAQTGTATRPAGYRTAARLIRLADRLGIPVLTLVDTPGAANDAEAERQGAGAAIADVFGAVAAARTPVTTLLIGEGGSGGALALAAPDNTWATPDSYFSVIAPELAAAILKRPPEEVRATADQLRIRPQDLVDLGVVRGIVEPTKSPS